MTVMKSPAHKVFLIVMAAVPFVLGGCGKKEEEAPVVDNTPAAAQVAAPTPAADASNEYASPQENARFSPLTTGAREEPPASPFAQQRGADPSYSGVVMSAPPVGAVPPPPPPP